MDLKFKNLSILYPEEGARAKFENLVAQALSTVYPGSYQIRPTRGDRGIDIFKGTLSPSPDSENEPLKIYQCKYFLDRIDASRRGHIKESLLRARGSYPHLDTWVLCVPCSLSNEEAEWWQRLQRNEGDGLHMELYDENRLLDLLRRARIINELAVTPPEQTLASGMTRGGASHFIGREKELSNIREQFEAGKNVVVLYGIAGIGKSELAKRFFEISEDLFQYAQFVFIDENSPMRQDAPGELLQTALQKLHFSLAFERSCVGLRPEEQMRLRHSALTELTQTTLLIIDNANDLTERDLCILLDYPCRFLVTTRRKINGKNMDRFGFVPVEEMETEDLVKVFEKNYGPVGAAMRPGLDELFEKIVHHTMTVELVAALMRSQSMDLREVLDTITSLDKSDARVSYLHNDSKQETATITEHLQALFDLSRTTEEETYLLRNLALVSSCGVDSKRLKTWLGLKNNNAFLSLAEKRWLKYSHSEEYVQLHPLVSRLCFLAFPPTPDDCGGLIRGITALLQFENCAMISEVQAVMSYGIFLADRLEEAGIQEPELLMRLADGYAILGETEKSKSLAFSLIEQSVNPVFRAQAVILVARLHLIQLNYRETSEWYEQNRLLLNAPELWRQKAILLLQLGNCYYALNNERLNQECLVECFHLYIKHDNVIGASIALTGIFQFCRPSPVLRWTLFHRFKRLCYQKARENPISLLLYLNCRTLFQIPGDARQFSSMHQLVDEFTTHLSKAIPFYRVMYDMRRQIKLLRKSGNIRMAGWLEALFASQEEDSSVLVSALWGIQTEISRQCKEIGITPDIFSIWTILLEYIPEIDFQTVFPLLEETFKEYEKRMLVSYYNVLPVLINYAKVKDIIIGFREGMVQLQHLIEYQIKVLPAVNRCYLVTSYEALGDMYDKAHQKSIAKEYYKQALAILREAEAAPSEIARLLYKLDYNKNALALLQEHGIYNCVRCQVCQDLGGWAQHNGEWNQMRYYYCELRRNAHKFKGCSSRCYAETLVRCGNSVSRTSHSGIPYYFRAFLIGSRLRRPFSGAADNAYYLARYVQKRGAKDQAKQLVVYGLDYGIKCADTRICQSLICFHIVSGWDRLWKEFFRKTAWRLYWNPSKDRDEPLLLLLHRYLRTSNPSFTAYARALKDLYADRLQEYRINSYTGATDIIVSKLLSTKTGRALIANAHSGKRLLCDAQEYVLTTFLCETLSFGPLLVKSSLDHFKEFMTTLQQYVDRGEICAAEDILFAYREKYPLENLDLIAKEFYRHLEAMPDSDLADAHFSREEIAEGYQDFFQLRNTLRQ